MVSPRLCVDLIEFKPVPPDAEGQVLGYASVHVPAFGFDVLNMRLLKRGGRVTVFMPKMPVVKNDELVRDEFGRIAFRHALRFRDNDAYQEFATAVRAVLYKEHPEAFDGLDVHEIREAAER